MESNNAREFPDINIPRKRTVVDQCVPQPGQRTPSPPLFSLVEFNLSGLCNRKCVFCPRVDPRIFPNRNEHISVELFERVMLDLAAIGFRGMLLYSGFGEPLLHKHVEALIAISRRHCRDARLELVTNGDYVTVAKLRALFEAGLDTLLISLYDGPHQVSQFREMMATLNLTEEQVVLRTRWLPAEQHFGMVLTNRAGMVEIADVGVGRLSEPLRRRCHYPFYMVMVDYDGSVLLCTHDWGRKLIVGNLNHDNLLDLWNGDLIRNVRHKLAAGDRTSAPCSGCDADGTIMGQAHLAAWTTHYARDAMPAQ